MNLPSGFPVYDTFKANLASPALPVHGCHRGGSEEYGPENTMHTFRNSVYKYNTQLLELDFTLTKDGVVVLIHDQKIDRTTNGKGKVSKYTLEKLQKFDAAWNYPELRGQGINIPTFDEFLAEFMSVPNLVFMLDFKYKEAVEQVLALVEKNQLWDRVILGSVVGGTNNLLSSLRPNKGIPVCTDAASTTGTILAHFTGMSSLNTITHDIFGFMLFPSTSGFWKKSLVDTIHAKGKPIMLCGADSREDIMEGIEWGVEIILTNRPDILRQTFDEYILLSSKESKETKDSS